MMNRHQHITDKIFSKDSLGEKLKYWKESNEKIVFTNGCFDIIHRGHVDYLSKAADLGTKLIIRVNTDASTSKLKGQNRPIQDEYSRLIILASFEFVDAV